MVGDGDRVESPDDSDTGSRPFGASEGRNVDPVARGQHPKSTSRGSIRDRVSSCNVSRINVADACFSHCDTGCRPWLSVALASPKQEEIDNQSRTALT